MKRPAAIQCLFLDIGGVLMTNGWDHQARDRAATTFHLDRAELELRHHWVFDTYETGKLTLEEYLDRAVFHRKRAFTRERFKRFMFAQSKAFPGMIALISRLKARYGLTIAVVSNEGRELNAHRIKISGLDKVVDVFVSSCYVHLRKPDVDIFKLALDLVQTPPRRVVYIENTALFVQVAQGLAIRSILHKDLASTRAALASYGLA
jgi:putative hydrolase of the HAD superfamily